MKLMILQLGLLIWKCWKTESRKKIRVACEIVFPLFMFVIVVAVRNSLNLRKSQDECHFGAKPMLSAGIVPFLQGLICNSNNTCQVSKTLGEDTRYPFNKTLISSFQQQTPTAREPASTQSSSSTDSNEASNLLASVSAFWDAFCDEPFPSVALDSFNKQTTTPSFSSNNNNAAFGLFNPRNCLIRYPSTAKLLRNNSSNNSNNSSSQPGGATTTTTNLLMNITNNAAELEAILECRRFICVLQSVAPLWVTVSRLLMGRIVYYPNTTLINNLMSHVEQGLNWANVLQEALELSNMYSAFSSSSSSSNSDSSRYLNNNNNRQAQRNSGLVKLLSCLYMEGNRFEGVESVEKLISKSMQYAAIQRFTAAIEFYDTDKLQGDRLPGVVRYALRLDPSNLDKTTEVKDRPFNIRVRRGPMNEMPYFLTGFIYLQDVIDKVIIRMQIDQQERETPQSTNPIFAEVGSILQQFPFPCYLDDVFLQVLANQLTMYIVLGWIFLAAIIVKSIVLEKEQKLREVARIMGISPGLHFLSWFIFWSFLMLATVLLFLLILKVGGIFVYTSAAVILVFMIVYSFATISFCFFISSFFNRANVAAVVSGLVYFLTYIAYAGITNANMESLNLQRMLLSSLLPNIALGYGWQIMANYELTTEGASFAKFNVPVSDEPADQFTLAHATLLLLVDMVLYYFLAWYIDYVFPGEFGVPLPWYFVFQPSFWCNGISTSFSDYHLYCHCGNRAEGVFSTNNNNHRKQQLSTVSDSKNFEPEPRHLKIGCALKSVSKMYNYGIFQRIRRLFTSEKKTKKATSKAAVDHLSLNMFEGQITALLGHNGAGKTTTMSIMTGLIPATSGSVSVYGHDVATELSTVRRMMGFCPQFNVLYEELTVSEHMWFFAKIRGHANGQVACDIERMLKDTDLTLKRDEPAKVLSGGMRRRLSIAVAFIGDAKCIILDEPTAGVDPYARRQIWTLLSKLRKNRTIMLSTHHMQEAEILADRIAVISNGRLQTAGSPLYLKQVHGEGYKLTIVRDAISIAATANNSAVLSESDREHERQITRFINSNLPPAVCRMTEHSGVEIQYHLGYEGVAKFAGFFNALDEAMANLKVQTYGVSDSNLEEIFIKIAQQAEFDSNNNNNKNKQEGEVNGYSSEDTKSPPASVTYEPFTGIRLISLQFYGLLVKRYHRMRRSWKGFIVELLLPVLFVLLGVVIIKVAEYKPGNSPPLELVPWAMAPGSRSTRDQRLYTFFSAANKKDDILQISDSLAKASATSEYPGTRCMSPAANYSIDNYPCYYDAPWNESQWLTDERYRLRDCKCTNDGVQQCSGSTSNNNSLPNYRYLRTKDDVLNLTGFDISSYILSQFKALKHNLYGGWSFTVPSPPIGVMISTWISSMSPNPYWPKLFSPGSILVWFNNKGWLSSVAYNNYVNNMLLRLALSTDLDSPNITYGIVTVNHPLNYTTSQFSERLQMAAFVDVMLAIMLILALSFVPASFVMFLIEDRVSDSKHVQMVSGLRPAIYWLANYTWDCINYLVPVVACVIIFEAFNVEAYVYDKSVGALVLLFIMYGFAVAPMLYPTSLYFSTPSTAFVVLACASLFIGSGTTIATWFLDLLYMREKDDSLQNVNEILKVFFFIFPQYCFGRGLINLALSYRTAQGQAFFLGSSVMESHQPFNWDVCGQFLLALFLHNIGWLAVNIILAYYLPYVLNKFAEIRAFVSRKASRFWRRRWPTVKNVHQQAAGVIPNNEPALNDDDADVAEERQLILGGQNSSRFDPKKYTLIVKDLTKKFETSQGRLTAVDKLSFGVPVGQCFGLLGVNGAGKSTTFNMLTGLLIPTSGTASIRNHDILSSRNQANKLIGYCPQYDCITPLLSGRENLEFFARLHGVPERFVRQIADFNLKRLDLTKHADKPAGAYSGGNKRKLSVAIALSGDPPLILLDEPTAGIDPRARRHVWRAVSGLLRNSQSVILTSHSMDECEALCNRLAIMVNGRFRCLGSPQHLKARFGEGYMLTLRFSSSLNNDTKQYPETAFRELKLRFGDVALKETHDTVAVFSLGASGREPVKIGELFAFLTNTDAMTSLNICDYSLMQSSLDAVFVTFAKKQRSDQIEDQLLINNNDISAGENSSATL